MHIRRGLTRTVLITKKYAIKVPSFRTGCGYHFRDRFWSLSRGWLANDSELTWWNNSKDPALCPVLKSWLWGWVQVYPRCELIDVEIDLKDYPKPEYRFPGDRKNDNLGILNGRLVWIDYDSSYNGCSYHQKEQTND